MRAFIWTLLTLALLVAPAGGQAVPAEYERISQCVLAGERAALAGQKVQLTGKLVSATGFCHRIRKAGINTEDYVCFTLGELCIIRLYLHEEHPDVPKLKALEDGQTLTAFGTFDYMGQDYNYVIVDGIALPED